MYYLKIAGLELIIFYIQREFVKILRSPKVFFSLENAFNRSKFFEVHFFCLPHSSITLTRELANKIIDFSFVLNYYFDVGLHFYL